MGERLTGTKEGVACICLYVVLSHILGLSSFKMMCSECFFKNEEKKGGGGREEKKRKKKAKALLGGEGCYTGRRAFAHPV